MQGTALSLNRVIRAPREKVFAAWTTPDLLVQWWGPGAVTCPEAQIDLRVGGAYRMANREVDGSVIWISGHFEAVRVPEELAYTWVISSIPAEPTLVRVLFRLHPEGTELVLTHERFAQEALRDMHRQGWGGCLDKLETMLVS